MSDSTKAPGQFCWNELLVRDAKAAAKFYGALFGWDTQSIDLPDGTYTFFKKSDQEIGGMWEIPAEQASEIPPNWLSYILVDDLSATVEKAKQLGATIRMPITPVPGYGRFAVITDTTQAVVGLWEKENS